MASRGLLRKSTAAAATTKATSAAPAAPKKPLQATALRRPGRHRNLTTAAATSTMANSTLPPAHVTRGVVLLQAAVRGIQCRKRLMYDCLHKVGIFAPAGSLSTSTTTTATSGCLRQSTTTATPSRYIGIVFTDPEQRQVVVRGITKFQAAFRGVRERQRLMEDWQGQRGVFQQWDYSRRSRRASLSEMPIEADSHTAARRSRRLQQQPGSDSNVRHGYGGDTAKARLVPQRAGGYIAQGTTQGPSSCTGTASPQVQGKWHGETLIAVDMEFNMRRFSPSKDLANPLFREDIRIALANVVTLLRKYQHPAKEALLRSTRLPYLVCILSTSACLPLDERDSFCSSVFLILQLLFVLTEEQQQQQPATGATTATTPMLLSSRSASSATLVEEIACVVHSTPNDCGAWATIGTALCILLRDLTQPILRAANSGSTCSSTSGTSSGSGSSSRGGNSADATTTGLPPLPRPRSPILNKLELKLLKLASLSLHRLRLCSAVANVILRHLSSSSGFSYLSLYTQQQITVVPSHVWPEILSAVFKQRQSLSSNPVNPLAAASSATSPAHSSSAAVLPSVRSCSLSNSSGESPKQPPLSRPSSGYSSSSHSSTGDSAKTAAAAAAATPKKCTVSHPYPLGVAAATVAESPSAAEKRLTPQHQHHHSPSSSSSSSSVATAAVTSPTALGSFQSCASRSSSLTAQTRSDTPSSYRSCEDDSEDVASLAS